MKIVFLSLLAMGMWLIGYIMGYVEGRIKYKPIDRKRYGIGKELKVRVIRYVANGNYYEVEIV